MNITTEHITAMDNAKFEIFLKRDGAFLGSLLCNVDIEWSDRISTACTNGLKIEFNPDWFMSLPEPTRPTILLHELWHIGHLHILRGEDLEPRRFNKAADYVINLQLDDEGNSFAGADPLLDQKWRNYTSEQVYDALPEEPPEEGRGCWSQDPGDMDMEPAEDDGGASADAVVQVVHAAVVAQERTGYSSDHVEAISEMIRKRNQPKVNWKAELKDFCQERARAGLDYRKRNRRYTHVIMPARGKRGRLTELDFFFDVSGSVTTAMVEQMKSELAYIHGVLKPKKLNLIQFDTSIRHVQSFMAGQAMDEIQIHGRGGTSLNSVANWLEKNQPSGAVIMTDLDCPIMQIVKGVPILWLCINNPSAFVQQGKLIHIEV